jgi:hypothetical protein
MAQASRIFWVHMFIFCEVDQSASCMNYLGRRPDGPLSSNADWLASKEKGVKQVNLARESFYSHISVSQEYFWTVDRQFQEQIRYGFTGMG